MLGVLTYQSAQGADQAHTLLKREEKDMWANSDSKFILKHDVNTM